MRCAAQRKSSDTESGALEDAFAFCGGVSGVFDSITRLKDRRCMRFLPSPQCFPGSSTHALGTQWTPS